MINQNADEFLIQQDKKAAIGEQLENIIHQFRQPLNVILLLVDDMKDCYDAGEFSKEYFYGTLGQITGLIQHMSGTVEDFRNFLRSDKEKARFSLREAVDKMLSFISPEIKNMGIKIVTDVPENLYAVGFRNEFIHALLNIINNAKDALVERKVTRPEISIKGFREENVSVVTITDNAGGISEDIIDKIFDNYFTTKNTGIATGIGLHMSKMLIERHMHGKLRVENVNGGSSFIIEILSNSFVIQ